eukprot:CAMPEP_0181048544 /NCGR_PEP_ID=MMETSP1070-20121207/15493_1 /TAXON_ID=265543 /ORGANISM="Minutocellus polymorphus, Strain NH13" /LENGTH=307 /DNA_ID=CAMNT_0023127337 /DNA_START=112 /DNA_END=1035 /DNA_ORIENTATION=-
MALAHPAEAFVNVPVPSATSLVAPPRIGAISQTELSMGNLGDRASRIIKSNINEAVNSLENPEKIVEQAVEDMSNDLAKVRASYAEITATQRKLMKQRENMEADAVKWFNKASLALKYDQENLAREALARRQLLLDSANDLGQDIDAQAPNIDTLYNNMQVLEGRIVEAKRKKEQIKLRAKQARMKKDINDMQNENISGALGSLEGTSSAMATFTRMEEKVEALEAVAEASAEMHEMQDERNAMISPAAKLVDMEFEFKAMEKSAAVDSQLKKLKAMLEEIGQNPGTYVVTGTKDNVKSDDEGDVSA